MKEIEKQIEELMVKKNEVDNKKKELRKVYQDRNTELENETKDLQKTIKKMKRELSLKRKLLSGNVWRGNARLEYCFQTKEWRLMYSQLNDDKNVDKCVSLFRSRSRLYILNNIDILIEDFTRLKNDIMQEMEEEAKQSGVRL